MSSLRGYWAILLTAIAAGVAVITGVVGYLGGPNPIPPTVGAVAHTLARHGPVDQGDNAARGDPAARQVVPRTDKPTPP
jgi:hypothetical protein